MRLHIARGDTGSARPLRGIRWRARAPRLLVTGLVVILCIAGVRAIVSPRPAIVREVAARTPSYDIGAGAFAEAFASAYLTWNATDLTTRQTQLQAFLAQGLESDGGLQPASGTSQSVQSTAIDEETHSGGEIDVVIAAQTSSGAQYLSVAVARDARGMLYVAAYPALVGPPAADTAAPLPAAHPIADEALETVLSRALGNYLAGQAENLRADLTANAVVSLPTQPLRLRQTDSVNWLEPNHTVAVQVEVTDARADTLTLTYQLTVVMLDRWYVQSIQFDPTLQGGP